MALLGAIGIVGSLQVGIGWGAEGPKAGFFPFYIGSLIVLISCAVNLVQRIARVHRPRAVRRMGPDPPGACPSSSRPRSTSFAVPISACMSSSALLIAVFMKWSAATRWPHRRWRSRSACRLVTFFMFETLVPGAAAQGADRRLASGCDARPRVSDIGEVNMEDIGNLFHGFAVVLQPYNIAADGARHRARRHHRRAAGPRRRQRHRDPAAADLQHVADLGDHHAVLHLLGRAVRRRHHLGAVQHTGRTMVGGDHVRRLSDGAAGQGRRGADRGLHLVVRRRAVRRHHDHAGGAAGRELRAASSARRKYSRSISSPSAASSA